MSSAKRATTSSGDDFYSAKDKQDRITVNNILASDTAEIEDLSFLFVHFSPYCDLFDDNKIHDAFPGEFAILRFSLNGGLDESHTCLINTEIPTGLQYDYDIGAKLRGLPNYEEYYGKQETDLKAQIFDPIKNMAKSCEYLKKRSIILFSKRSDLDITAKCLSYCIQQTKGEENIIKYSVLPLEILVQLLSANIISGKDFAKENLNDENFLPILKEHSLLIMDKPIRDSPSLACFHHYSDEFKFAASFCSLSKVKRWAFKTMEIIDALPDRPLRPETQKQSLTKHQDFMASQYDEQKLE